LSSDRDAISRRSHARIRVLQEILNAYDGTVPFHRYLAAFFRRNHAFGSKDRKIYRKWSYAWFRLGRSLSELSFQERIFWAFFLVNGLDDELSNDLAQSIDGLDFTELNLSDRIDFVQKKFGEDALNAVFPFHTRLSGKLDSDNIRNALLRQPDVFIRMAVGKTDAVKKEFSSLGLPVTATDLEFCFSVPQQVDLLKTESYVNGFFEIQDYASQKVCEYFSVEPYSIWWDACCGSGGKTMLLADRYSQSSFVCSDIRSSIIENLKERVGRSGLSNISYTVLDASLAHPVDFKFQGVLVDAPCSGSGTWRRNPENLSFFNENRIPDFTERQLTILNQVKNAVASKGWLVYMTCSLFYDENEKLVDLFLKQNDYELFSMNLIDAQENNSDTLFVAVMRSKI
jgi:16S rRNA (cytosine967-C5)-methyltransferase